MSDAKWFVRDASMNAQRVLGAERMSGALRRDVRAHLLTTSTLEA